MGRDLLAYKLQTLTNTKQEVDFETFSRRLAEREICSNLLPQTGPTGGGDSKTDASTYPVAPVLTDRWYRGAPQTPSTEFWAFAFSAKADWRAKVQSDVAKIAGLQTRPSLIYFFSSQFIKDKDRAAVEASLSKKHGIPVKIVDRQWIVEKTIDNGHERLAVDTLHIEVPQLGAPPLGPRDAARNVELERLLTALRNPDPILTDYGLAEQYIAAARLSREMERPKSETERLLLQARELANRAGSLGQRLRAIYEYAWTVFWWFDDPGTTRRLYGDLEELACTSDDASDLELLSNVWMLLRPHADRAPLGPLKGKLLELARDPNRPNNAAHAESLAAVLELIANEKKANVPRILARIRTCLERSATLGVYPVRQLIDVISELGEHISAIPEYDRLLEEAAALAAARDADVSEGSLLLRRGFQLIRQDKHIEALVSFANARELLTKRESLLDAARAQLGCAFAYERLGLLWAARREVAMAFEHGMHLAARGRVPPFAARAASRMIWLEIQLGRLTHSLAWRKVYLTLDAAVRAQGGALDGSEEELEGQDLVFGILFLRATLEELSDLTRLPDSLADLGWTSARTALLFALGYVDEVRREWEGTSLETSNAEDVFSKWLTLADGADMPPRLCLHSRLRERYETVVLGTTITVELDNAPGHRFLAEELLGALEGFFATLDYRVSVFTTGQLHFDLRSTAFEEFPPRRSKEGWTWTYRISQKFMETVATPKGLIDFRQWLLEAIAEVADASSIVVDTKSFRNHLKESGAVGRALFATFFGGVPVASETELSSWTAGTEFQLRRDTPWLSPPPKPDSKPIRPAEGPVPEGLKAMPRHKDFRVVSVIDVPAWNAARWMATGIIAELSAKYPPALVIAFKNPEAGKKIFRDWRQKLGARDEDEQIRVAVIDGTGPDGTRYVVSVGPNYDRITSEIKPDRDGWSRFVGISRFNEMTPAPGSRNLELLKEFYQKTGRFILMPGTFDGGDLRGFPDLAIEKRALTFKRAEDITEHDFDRVAIRWPRATERGDAQKSGAGGSPKRAHANAKKKARKEARKARKKGRR